MLRNLRIFTAVAVATALAVTLAACSGTSDKASTGASGKPKQGGTLTIADPDQPLSGLDPTLAQAFDAKKLGSQFYESLLSLSADGKTLKPGLATSWKETSPTEYVFTLRKGVQFHNGDELTPEDVVYSIERVLDPATASPYTNLYSIASVKAQGDDQVVIDLKSPQASLLRLLAQPWSSGIFDEAWMKTKTVNDLKTQENGTGPYKLVSYQEGSVIKTARFDKYWDAPKPYIDEVDYRVIPDESTLVQALTSGTVDMGQIDLPTDVAKVTGAGLSVGKAGDIGTVWMAMDTLNGPLANIDVRRAVNLAIDRKKINTIVALGKGTPYAGVVPPGDPLGCTMSASSPDYTYSPSQAKKLVAQSGESDIAISIKIQSDATASIQAAQLMKQELAAVGITLNIDVVPFSSLVSNILSTDWGSDMVALTSTLNADPSQYVALWFAKGSPTTHVNDPKLWSMMDAAQAETGSADKRKQDYQGICNYVAQQAYMVTPYAAPYYYDVWNSKKVEGFVSDVTQTRLLLKDAWLQ